MFKHQTEQVRSMNGNTCSLIAQLWYLCDQLRIAINFILLLFFIFIHLPLRPCHFLSGHKEWPHLCKQPWCTKRWRWKYSNSIIYTICQNRRQRERKFRNEPRWSSWRRRRRRGDSHPRRPFSICLANQRRNGETLIRLNQFINNLMLTLREALTIC